jgi:hypothetical protein
MKRKTAFENLSQIRSINVLKIHAEMIIQFTNEIYISKGGGVLKEHTVSIFRAYMVMLGITGIVIIFRFCILIHLTHDNKTLFAVYSRPP